MIVFGAKRDRIHSIRVQDNSPQRQLAPDPRQLAPDPRQLALVRLWSETTRPIELGQLALFLLLVFYTFHSYMIYATKLIKLLYRHISIFVLYFYEVYL